MGASGLLHGCTKATAEGLNVAPSAQIEAARTGAQASASTSQTPAQPASVVPPSAKLDASTGAVRTVYDLAAHLDHADLYRGQTLLVKFGEPGAAKYTLGGWGTRIKATAQIDGSNASVVSGSYGDVVLPIQRDEPTVIQASLRAPRDGDITVYLDDAVLTRIKSDPSRFNTIRIELPREKATRGEHMLRLRASGMGKIGNLSTALAIDWFAMGPSSTPAVDAVPGAASLRAQPSRLNIPDGHTLAFAMAVPDAAHLVGEVSGAPASKLRVRATFDDLSQTTLGEYGAGRFDVDLTSLRGIVARLELEAVGEIGVVEPRVVVPRGEPLRSVKPARNVLVYLVDTLRADHLKPFNHGTRVRTPGLDQLVEQGGAVFSSAHTQENWTKPSVATLLSSLMPWEHHAVTTEAVVPSDIKLLPEVLSERGFATGAFIANGYVSDKFGFKQGFGSFRNYIREGRYSRAEFLAADVLDWLDKRDTQKPFFLYVHAIDPHVPYKPTSEFLSLYDPQPYDGVVNFNGDSTLLEKIKIGSIKLNARDKVHLEALYDSEISYHDVHFRSILTALEKRGLAGDTMVVVVADHGEEFWDHGSVGHGHSVYEELLHIPMVIRVPGVSQGPVRVESSAGLVDIMPTVLEALGQELPAELSGRSLLPELTGRGADAPPVAVSGFMDGWRTAVVSGLKLIQRTEKRVSVHDLALDPSEQKDVATSRPITTRYLRGQLGLVLARTEPSEEPGARKVAHRGENTTIDAETEAQLRALGYVGSSRR